MANRWSNERIICEYAIKTNSIAIYINYRLAPEYQHPTAIYDCYDVYKVRDSYYLRQSTYFNMVLNIELTKNVQYCWEIVQVE